MTQEKKIKPMQLPLTNVSINFPSKSTRLLAVLDYGTLTKRREKSNTRTRSRDSFSDRQELKR